MPAFIKAFREGGQIESNGCSMTLKLGQVKPSAVKPVMHRPIFALIARASSRSRRIESRPLGGSRKVSIEKPDLARLHIFGLKAWPGLPEKFLAIAAGKIGIFDERDGGTRIAPKPDIRRRSTVRLLPSGTHRKEEENAPQQHSKRAAVPCPTVTSCHTEALLIVIDRSSSPFHLLMLLFLMDPSFDGRFRRSGRHARFANAIQFAQTFD